MIHSIFYEDKAIQWGFYLRTAPAGGLGTDGPTPRTPINNAGCLRVCGPPAVFFIYFI
jgi:hypothetical protein